MRVLRRAFYTHHIQGNIAVPHEVCRLASLPEEHREAVGRRRTTGGQSWEDEARLKELESSKNKAPLAVAAVLEVCRAFGPGRALPAVMLNCLSTRN